MNNVGRSRNARLNQAGKFLSELSVHLSDLRGFQSTEHVDNKDAWADGRSALAQLVQCFHEANAYNNAMELPAREVAEDATALTRAANVSSPGRRT